MRGHTRLLRAVLVVPLIAVAAIGVASAYWSASGGSGSGSGSAGSSAAVSLGPGVPVATLTPGGRAGVDLVISNPNPFPLHLASLALDTSQGTAGFAVDAGHSGCSVSSLSFATQTNAGAGWSVPAQAGSDPGELAVSLTDAVTMATTAANACQGALFTVYLESGQ